MLPLDVVLAAISITGKLILNSDRRRESFTWPHYGYMKSNFILENKGKGFSFNVFAFGSFSVYISIQMGFESFL